MEMKSIRENTKIDTAEGGGGGLPKRNRKFKGKRKGGEFYQDAQNLIRKFKPMESKSYSMKFQTNCSHSDSSVHELR
jgi:hypothetical protein